MSIQASRERKAALHKEANHLLAERGDVVWSKDDQQKFDQLMDQITRVDAQIDAHEKMLQADTDKNFNDAHKFKKVPAKQKSEAHQALDVFLRKMPRDITPDEALMIRNTMSTTIGSEGGFTVQTEVANDLIEALKKYGSMRRVAAQISTEKGNDLNYPTTDGTAEIGEWVAQNIQAAAADPTFGTRPLNVFKAGSRTIAVPIELLQDSEIDVQALVFNRMGTRIGRLANLSYTVGTGTGQPNGIITAGTVGKIGTTGQTLTVNYDDLVDVVDSLDANYLESGEQASWMFSQATRRIIRKIKDTSGRPIWAPSYEAGMSAETPDTLLGYPIEINNDVPVMAANAKSIAFGMLNRYMIRDAMQVTLFRFDDSAFVTKGQIGFLGWARTGGNLMDLAGVRLYQNSAT
jgi:HK97 family phage major capsid protein